MAGRGGFNAITPEQMRCLLAIRASDLDDDECDEAIMQEVSRIEAAITDSSLAKATAARVAGAESSKPRLGDP
jgi:hypothetical protein